VCYSSLKHYRHQGCWKCKNGKCGTKLHGGKCKGGKCRKEKCSTRPQRVENARKENVRNVVMWLRLYHCLFLCLSVHSHISEWKPHGWTSPNFCTWIPWLCLGPRLTVVQYVIYLWFCAWSNCFTHWAPWCIICIPMLQECINENCILLDSIFSIFVSLSCIHMRQSISKPSLKQRSLETYVYYVTFPTFSTSCYCVPHFSFLYFPSMKFCATFSISCIHCAASKQTVSELGNIQSPNTWATLVMISQFLLQQDNH